MHFRKYILIGLAILFMGSILWSMYFETLLPVIKNESMGEVLKHVIGLVLVLAGLAFIVIGGFKILRVSLGYLTDRKYTELSEKVNSSDDPELKWKGRKYLAVSMLKGWMPGGLFMLGGFVCFAIAGYIVNH